MKRKIWIAFLLTTCGLCLVSATCDNSPVQDCTRPGQSCKEGSECREVFGGYHVCIPVPLPSPTPGSTATPIPTTSPSPSPSPTATATHTPTPPASPTPTPSASPSPSATPTRPAPSPTPCAPRVEKACFAGQPFPLDPPDFSYQKPIINPQTGNPNCHTCAQLKAYWANSYWTPGDPAEDSDARTDGMFPRGLFLNGPDDRGNWECVSKATCDRVRCNDPSTVITPFYIQFPPAVREVKRECPVDPTPTPPPPPHATPTPGAGGCPSLLKMGGSFLSAVSCGQNCIKQGYLGFRVNVTSTELCREGDPGCVCDPARNRCEMPRQCQNILGAKVYLSLAGHFTHDLCDQNSDNAFNCHHKPKVDETGVTEFMHCPPSVSKDDLPSALCTPKCYDIQAGGVREVNCPGARNLNFFELMDAPLVKPVPDWENK